MQPKEKIQLIKQQIIQIRSLRGPRAKIPTSLWLQIQELSRTVPLKDLCQSIDIDHTNARSKIKRLQQQDNNEVSPQPLPPLIQLKTSPSPVMELSLKNGTIIRVFDL